MACTNDEVRAALQLEYEIFVEAAYIGPNSESLVLEYAPFNAVSDFVVAFEEDQVVGVLRRIKYHADLGIKTLRDFDIRAEWRGMVEEACRNSPALVEEIGTLALKKERRGIGGRAFTMSIYRVAWQESVRRGVKYWLFSVDERLFKTLVGLFGAFAIGDPMHYMGSVTVPALLEIQRIRERYERGEDALLAGYFLTGL